MTTHRTATLPTPRSPATLSHARRVTRLQFMGLGVLVGTWGAHIPSVRAHYALDEMTLSLVLLAAALGTVGSLLVAGRIVGWLGARSATALAAGLACVSLGIVLELPGLIALLPLMLIFGAAMSILDVSINTEGAALESLSGRPIMSNLHGMFSVGGMTGAALASLMLGAGIAPRLQLFGVCAGVAIVALFASRWMLETHADSGGESGDGGKVHFAWPRDKLLIIGLLILAGMTAEGVMYDWCVLYLNQEVGMSQARAALGYATFSGAMAASRFGGDALRARYSERGLLRFGAGMAAVAMAVVLLSAHPWVALLGFALAGAGLAPVAPILFNAATRVPGVSRAAAIASVTSIGYSGFMIGPPLIGSIATATSLTAALGVVVLASGLLTYGARFVPEKGD
ncbi:MAG: MFS transporter [Betaproteobacteria bacterium]|nr:MFS transporter [Betaproteobacteria bacterium]